MTDNRRKTDVFDDKLAKPLPPEGAVINSIWVFCWVCD